MENIEHPTGVLRRAIELAKVSSTLSDYHDFKLGAVIFDHHRIYCFGYNTVKSSPKQRFYNRLRSSDYADWANHGCHAEMRCVQLLLNRYYANLPEMNKLSIFIYRANNKGMYRLAKPCSACAAVLKDVGIKNIYYTGNNSIIYERYN